MLKTIDNNDSPKVIDENKTVFIDIPERNNYIQTAPPSSSVSADIVEINYDVNRTLSTENSGNSENEKINKLSELIIENKKKISNNIYIISCKYDSICHKYNSISLSLLIISTIITFIEAIRLTIVNYDTQSNESHIGKYISQETISLIINCLSLSLSTILTILSSIARFKNYKENMDKLKTIRDLLFNYKNLYNKQQDLLKYFKITNTLTNDVFEKIKDTISDYDNELKGINIFENIRNTDIIKFNKIKVSHDIYLQKLTRRRELELLRLTYNSNKEKKEIEEGKINSCVNLF